MKKQEMNVIHLKPGDYLIREKTGCDSLFIVKEGQLEVYRTAGQGERIPLGIISSGQYVGEAALLLGSVHTSNVIALTPVSCIELSRASIEAQLKVVPPWLLALTKGLIERLHNANETMRRNGWIDDKLADRVKAVEDKYKKAE